LTENIISTVKITKNNKIHLH